ncbi:MAG TPA: UDP-glucose 4-epimerase GalE [Candidatus Saccharimonadales bacterium]|nr:UDP-glucose 4-epimerase GalE [Candidatus Saccharimonadales bacterium]
MKVLVTGGAGYIGSHTLVELAAAGHQAVVVDNLVNSDAEALRRVEEITGQQFPFYQIDCADKQALAKVFAEHAIGAVIHFAGLKSVGESVNDPLGYYRTNLDSTLSLCEAMQDAGVHRLLFSSSATVYGTPESLPLTEESTVGQNITNPYGETKYVIERLLQYLAKSDPTWRITLLRYFNPIGAHQSGRIGEDPGGVPNNLMPYVAQVAVGRREAVQVFGNDYDTPDGTGVRDYIHVVDLAKGHVAAIEQGDKPGVAAYNLGTGKGTSVLELIHAFEKACGKPIPYNVVARRPGDLASVYADVSKAKRELHWQATKTIEDACADSWRWQQQNPTGYNQPATANQERNS